MGAETVEYVVKKDDSLWNIVKAAGFPPKDWKKIYAAKYNDRFRKDHPDPDKIFKGDKLRLPKYGPNAYAHLLSYLKEQETALGYYRDRIKAIEKSIAIRDETQAAGKAHLAKLKKEAEALRDMGHSANDECSGDWEECLGAGMYANKMFREARGVMKEYDKYEKFMKAKKYDKGLKDMQATLVKLKKDRKLTAKYVESLKKATLAALKDPYK